MTDAAEYSPEWKRGWSVVAAAAVAMGCGTGLWALTSSLFIQPLEQAFGWSRSQIALLNLLGLLSALAMPVVGLLVDRIGARRVATTGLIILGCCLLAFTTLSGSLVQLYSIGVCLAIAGTMSTPIVLTRPIAIWFEKSRGLALGLTMSGVSVSAVIFYPLLQNIIVIYGWRGGFVALAILPLLIGAPIVGRFLIDAPRDDASILKVGAPATASQSGTSITDANSTKPSEEMGSVFRDSRFWLLLLCMALANLPVGGILSQLQPLLSARGFGGREAALMGSVYAGSIAIGRITTGFLLDKLWAPGVAALALLLPVAGLWSMVEPTPSLIIAYVAAFLFGLAQGAEADFCAFFIPRFFGLQRFGAIMGILMFVIAISLAIGGISFASIYDRTGDYALALILSMAALASAAVAIVGTAFSGRKSDKAAFALPG